MAVCRSGKQKLNVKAWKAFMNVFNVMPLAARIAQKIFCVHSGLSPHLDHLEQLRTPVEAGRFKRRASRRSPEQQRRGGRSVLTDFGPMEVAEGVRKSESSSSREVHSNELQF